MNCRNLLGRIVSGLFLILGIATSQAANATWNGTVNSIWATTGNWSATPVPSLADIATFNNAGNGNTTISLGSGAQINAIIFNTPNAGAYTIGAGGPGSEKLTMNGSGWFTVNSTVTNSQIFNAGLILSTANGNRTPAFTNNSTTPGQNLIFTGGMTTANTGTKTVLISGAGNTVISGAMNNGAGLLALTKSGTGALTLSGALHTYAGPTLVSGGRLVNSATGGSPAATATLTVGNVPGASAILAIQSGANFTNYSLAIGATAIGAVFQTGGQFTLVDPASIADFRIGDGVAGYGYYRLSGGTLVANEVGVGGGNTGSSGTVGVMDITGGTFNNAGWITVGRGGTTSSGVLNVSGSGSILCAGTVGGSKISFKLGLSQRALRH